MKNVIIAGVAGFIGTNIAHKLLDSEDIIIHGIDNLSNGDISLMYPLLRNQNFNFIEESLLNTINIPSDEVYCCIGANFTSKKIDNIAQEYLNQIKIIENILNYTKLTGTKTVFIRQNIDTATTNSMLNFEQSIQNLITKYTEENKINVKIARITKIYGINCSKNRSDFITDTIIKALNNETIEISHDENGYLTYICDVANALKSIMETYQDEQVIDILSKEKSNIIEIVKMIAQLTKTRSKILLKSREIKSINYNLSSKTIYCHTNILKGLSDTIEHIKLMYFS